MQINIYLGCSQACEFLTERPMNKNPIFNHNTDHITMIYGLQKSSGTYKLWLVDTISK